MSRAAGKENRCKKGLVNACRKDFHKQRMLHVVPKLSQMEIQLLAALLNYIPGARCHNHLVEKENVFYTGREFVPQVTREYADLMTSRPTLGILVEIVGLKLPMRLHLQHLAQFGLGSCPL
mmetsp:Transcript_7549/g.15770  ORF Transcript_7549/g.15770 Transcript_7549/m.15770 type:complete len:121 (+) Transcript_7549:142-504(+)